jgi:hypothetical protein
MKTPSGWLFLVLLSALVSNPALAQDVGLGGGPRSGSVFIEASAGSVGQGYGTLWGGSAGAYVQGRVLGLVARTTVLPGNSSAHVYDAVLGPRLAVTLPFVRLWVEGGGGVGYTGNASGASGSGSTWGAAWQANAGISHGILPRIDWRILEVGYGHIYGGVGLSPVIASTGLTLHLF